MARRTIVRPVALLLATAFVLLVTGCSSELKNRDMTVLFKAGTTKAQLAAAARNCGHIEPDITPVPEPSLNAVEQQLAGNNDQIRFHIGGADDHDVAKVTDCLSRQHGVIGVQPPDDDMS